MLNAQETATLAAIKATLRQAAKLLNLMIMDKKEWSALEDDFRIFLNSPKALERNTLKPVPVFARNIRIADNPLQYW